MYMPAPELEINSELLLATEAREISEMQIISSFNL